MQTVQIIGENLHENLLIAITSTVKNPAISFAINVQFVENGREIKKAKLVLHTREHFTESILSFTGTLYVEKTSCPCMGYYYRKDPIQECWITTMEPETEIFKSKASKTEFIEMAKQYYKSQNLQYTKDGNLVNGFEFQNHVPKFNNLTDRFIIGKEIKVYTEMYKNIFPILRKNEEEIETWFGEFIDEYTIKTCSLDEALIRGANIY